MTPVLYWRCRTCRTSIKFSTRRKTFDGRLPTGELPTEMVARLLRECAEHDTFAVAQRGRMRQRIDATSGSSHGRA